VVGYASLHVPPLPPGKTYTLRISTTPQELIRVSTIKVLATQEPSSAIYPQVCYLQDLNSFFEFRARSYFAFFIAVFLQHKNSNKEDTIFAFIHSSRESNVF
jgi:hypothetical protein